MPPNPELLDRDGARARITMDLTELTDATRTVVDEGTQLLARLLMTAGRDGAPRAVHAALLLLFRHILEHADAVDELFLAGVFTPAGLQVRSIVEADMSLLYLTAQRSAFAASPDPQFESVVRAVLARHAADANFSADATAPLITTILDAEHRLTTCPLLRGRRCAAAESTRRSRGCASVAERYD
jgi:hypothetical protein